MEFINLAYPKDEWFNYPPGEGSSGYHDYWYRLYHCPFCGSNIYRAYESDISNDGYITCNSRASLAEGVLMHTRKRRSKERAFDIHHALLNLLMTGLK